LSDKFDIKKHKNYKLLEDFNKKNAFDIEEYIKRKGKGKGKVKMNRNTVITRL
jgi:TraG/TraD family protein